MFTIRALVVSTLSLVTVFDDYSTTVVYLFENIGISRSIVFILMGTINNVMFTMIHCLITDIHKHQTKRYHGNSLKLKVHLLKRKVENIVANGEIAGFAAIYPFDTMFITVVS